MGSTPKHSVSVDLTCESGLPFVFFSAVIWFGGGVLFLNIPVNSDSYNLQATQ